MTSDSTSVLQQLDAQLRAKYGGVTSKTWTAHDYLGIKWDFGVPGEVSMSMEGYINDIFKSYNVPFIIRTSSRIVADRRPPIADLSRIPDSVMTTHAYVLMMTVTFLFISPVHSRFVLKFS